MRKKHLTKRGLDPNYETEMLNKVLFYIREEYSEEIYQKITSLKFMNILTGYVFNCLSLKRPDKHTVPFMAQHLVHYASRSY